MTQEWKPGRLRKSLYIQRPHRAIVKEISPILDKLEVLWLSGGIYKEEILNRLFSEDSNMVKNYERKEYKAYFYGEGLTLGKTPPRRYYSQPQILGWDMFWAIEDATDAGRINTYGDYINWLQENFNPEIFHRIVINMALTFKAPEELYSMLSEQRLLEWVYDVAIWYANSFFLTPWEGAQKEIYALPLIREAVASIRDDLKVVRTTEVNDMKYMIDFVILTEERKPVLGISIKGASYYNARNSSYKNQGESREARGNALFTQEYNANTIQIISHMNSVYDEEFITKPIIEEMRKIKKCVK